MDSETKTCTKCKQTKPIDVFRKLHGKPTVCKECGAEKERRWRASRPPEQCDAERANDRALYHKNKERCQAEHKRWLAKPGKYERTLERAREYKRENRERIAAQRRNKHATDPARRLSNNLRARVQKGVRRDSALKDACTVDLIGCTWSELRSHIESLWCSGMSWDNYGYRGWHIDHIKPVASFDLTDPTQQRACFHYTNLQPLWAEDNLSKHDRLDWTPAA